MLRCEARRSGFYVLSSNECISFDHTTLIGGVLAHKFEQVINEYNFMLEDAEKNPTVDYSIWMDDSLTKISLLLELLYDANLIDTMLFADYTHLNSNYIALYLQE